MQTEQITKTPGRTGNRKNKPPRGVLDLATAEPNALREAVYTALWALDDEERAHTRDSILANLQASGVNLMQQMLVLGIPARTINELTVPDIAKLIRYVRINEPRAMKALVPVLEDFMNRQVEPARIAKASGISS